MSVLESGARPTYSGNTTSHSPLLAQIQDSELLAQVPSHSSQGRQYNPTHAIPPGGEVGMVADARSISLSQFGASGMVQPCSAGVSDSRPGVWSVGSSGEGRPTLLHQGKEPRANSGHFQPHSWLRESQASRQPLTWA